MNVLFVESSSFHVHNLSTYGSPANNLNAFKFDKVMTVIYIFYETVVNLDDDLFLLA